MDKKKILIIDDEEDFNYFIKTNLERKGDLEVITATSGEEGLKAVLDCRPDLILLDIIMPQMDGFEVLRRLKSTQSDIMDIPVIMLTAKRDSSSILRAEKFRVIDYIMKPFSVEELLRLIKKHV